MSVIQQRTIFTAGHPEDVSWVVDINSLKRVKDWVDEYPSLLTTDLNQMKADFPQWFVTIASRANPVACSCGEYIVPKEGQLSCISCNSPHRGHVRGIMWVGMIPVQLAGTDKVYDRVLQKAQSGKLYLPLTESGYLLVPIRIVYPGNWNREAPSCYYDDNFFSTLGISGANSTSHSHHMLSGGKMCLFDSWQVMTIRDVLRNRILPHALAQVRIADGKRPRDWFTR
jgi:hypothetical protein